MLNVYVQSGRGYRSPLLGRKLHQVLGASVGGKTHGSYGAGLFRFNHFCDLHNIPESQRMSLLSIFISSYGVGRVSSETVSTWLAGLQLWHAANNTPWAGYALLSRTRKGVSKLEPPSSRRIPRDPVSFNHMSVLRAALNLSNTRDSAIWAAASTAWRDCARLCELLIDSPSQFDSLRHVTRGCPKKRGTAANKHKFVQFKVPWTKTKKSAGDWITSTETFDDVDAVATLEHHLVVDADVSDSAPLFSYATQSGWAHLTRADFVGCCSGCCSEIWLAAGMAALNGHGFRIGGTTHLLLRGFDPWVVMKQGRWTSAAFLVYWRNVEEILPLFIGDSLDTFTSLTNSGARLANTI
ncbi:hypothetical protein FB451DRAFT_1352234 [Mycena latifolia]|nr:hypothetical protein FB451DRAFT_1352234 [Mycena latifolia]